MKIQYASDLHLEFPVNLQLFKQHKLRVAGDVLILAGDIHHYDSDYIPSEILDWFSKNYSQTIVIPGNHEFYNGYPINDFKHSYRRQLRDNITLLHNQTLTIGSIDFLCSTLWSELKTNPEYVKYRLNDFRKIQKANEDRITIQDYNELHLISRNYLIDELKKASTQKRVVISHHLPSPICVASQYQGDRMTEAFMVNMDQVINEYQPEYWVYGHSHGNVGTKTIGNTKLITNQFGYVPLQEHFDFRIDAIIEL